MMFNISVPTAVDGTGVDDVVEIVVAVEEVGKDRRTELLGNMLQSIVSTFFPQVREAFAVFSCFLTDRPKPEW